MFVDGYVLGSGAVHVELNSSLRGLLVISASGGIIACCHVS